MSDESHSTVEGTLQAFKTIMDNLPPQSECCADWIVNIQKVEAPMIFQSVRSGGRYQYDGVKFRYCPWCGKKRPQNETRDDKTG